jgi:ubiquinol-cytochrome c reductase cytochrome c subunit
MKRFSFVRCAGAAAVFVAAAWLALPQAPAQNSGSGSAAKTATANAENGKKIFKSYGCYECHDYQGQGAAGTGARINPPPPLPAMIAYIRAPKGQMPPYTAKVVSDAEVADIRAYLESLPKNPDPKTIPLLNNE